MISTDIMKMAQWDSIVCIAEGLDEVIERLKKLEDKING